MAVEAHKLKKGAYIIHVFIEEMRGLLAVNNDSTVDPICQVTIFGKKKFTKKLDDVGSTAAVYLGEHLFFMENHLEVQQVERGKILIEVKDHRLLGKSSLIGNYELDLAYVYQCDQHCIRHTWLALANTETGNITEARGYVKVGVNVVAEGDDQADLMTEEKKEGEQEILLPPSLQAQGHQIQIRIQKGEGFPKEMDQNGQCDVYIIAVMGQNQIQSSTKTTKGKDRAEYWLEDIYLPVKIPCVTGTLELKVYDYDSVGGDDLIGYLLFPFAEIQNGKYANYFWANIYGAHGDLSNEEAIKMNTFPQTGSSWKGRFLMKIWSYDEKKPKLLKTKELPKEAQEFQRKSDSETTSWELRTKIFNGTALPKAYNGYKLSVTVTCGDMVQSSQKEKSQNGRCDWFVNCGQKVQDFPISNIDQMPDVFIYLTYDDTKHICYYRIPAKQLVDINKEDFWIKLKPDLANGYVKETYDAGFVRVQIYLNKFGLNQDLSVGQWNAKIPSLNLKKWTLYANIFQCRGLASGDEEGTSDPYITVYCDGKEGKTQIQYETLNPIIYETFQLDCEFDNLDDAPPIIVQTWDYDKLGSDDLLGLVIVKMFDAAQGQPEPARPKWYNLNMDKPGTQEGQILMSFNLLPKGQALMLPPTGLRPKMKETSIDFQILGLRNLQSTGLFPVRKAFIKFDLSNLAFPGEEYLGQKSILTQPLDPGSNPNINTIISISAVLPEDPIFWPTMTCSVYDNLFKGLQQPQIGIFNIPLSDILKQDQKKEEEEEEEEEVFGEQIEKQFLRQEQEESKIQVQAKGSSFKEESQKPVKKQGYVQFNDEDEKNIKEAIQKGKVMDVNAIKQRMAFDLGIQKQSQEKMRRCLSIKQAKEGKFVRKPHYEKDENGHINEWNVPDPAYYMELGYDKTPGSGEKHYRYAVEKNLEDSQYVDPCPFACYDIWRGQNRGAQDNLWNRLTGVQNTRRKVGKFKGIINTKEQKQNYEDPYLNRQQKRKLGEELSKDMLNKTAVLVRVYILDCQNLMAMDSDSNSDPYIVLKLGKNVINDSSNYQEDQPNPKIFQVFDLETTLPGPSILKIQVWDHDQLFSDELIGQTQIDLEDRYFSKKWRSLIEKPIEKRSLRHKSSNLEVGTIRLFLDMFPKEKSTREIIKWDITPKPPAPFEARLIVWKTREVANVDVEGMSDLYIRAFINDFKAQETDTHLRCSNGNGSFNWRMVWPILLPQPVYRITIQIWDMDVFSFNDFIAEATIDFSETANKAFCFNARTTKNGQYDEPGGFLGLGKTSIQESEKFWVDCKRRNDKKELVDGGKVLISFELVPLEKAKMTPVGLGRDEPNVDPTLPQPAGRMELSLNPFKMLNQMVGPEFQAKIIGACCCVTLIALCIFIFPMVIGSVLGNAISPF